MHSHSVTGCPMNAGDLLGTGTISGQMLALSGACSNYRGGARETLCYLKLTQVLKEVLRESF